MSRYNRENLSDELTHFVLEKLNDWKCITSKELWIELANSSDDSSIWRHFGLGLYIRNEYLWKDEEIVSKFRNAGIWHVDHISSLMVEMWQNELRKEFSISEE